MPRKPVKRALAATGSLVAALLLAEVGLRVVDPFHTGEVLEREAFQRAILEPHPTLPAHAVLRAGAKSSFLGHPVEINEDRLRGPRVARDKPDGVFRIVVVGDSIAFGWGVAEQDAFPRVLERLLNEGPMPPGVTRFEVVNGSTPGWGIPSYYVFLRDFGLELAPDLVVVTFINNDLTDIIQVLDGGQATPDRWLELPRWAQGLYVARAVKDVHDILGNARGDFFLSLEAAPEVVDPAVDSAVDGFAGIAALCGGVPVVVMDTLGDGMGKQLDRFAAGLEERGIARVPAFLRREGYEETYAISPIDVHPNARGHREYAGWLRDWIVSRFVD